MGCAEMEHPRERGEGRTKRVHEMHIGFSAEQQPNFTVHQSFIDAQSASAVQQSAITLRAPLSNEHLLIILSQIVGTENIRMPC